MNEFTSIQLTKEVKDKLNELKTKEMKSYNDVIIELLNKQGSISDDVITIEREPVAFTLKYWDEETTKIKEITFNQLRRAEIGTEFFAYGNPKTDNWVNSKARVVYINNDDVILIVEEISYNSGAFDSITSVVHVKLF